MFTLVNIQSASPSFDGQFSVGVNTQRFIDACKGCGPGEIDAIVVQVAGALGCQRPFIENLVFMRPD